VCCDMIYDDQFTRYLRLRYPSMSVMIWKIHIILDESSQVLFFFFFFFFFNVVQS
jgi:hypothetical protein